MLPKINRIRKRKDFDIIFKKGKSFKNNLLVLRVIKNSLKQSRFGFIASLKVSKKAAARNKIRRRLSEIIRAEHKDIEEGLDLVFICLAEIEKKDFSEIKSAVNNLLIKAKILNV